MSADASPAAAPLFPDTHARLLDLAARLAAVPLALQLCMHSFYVFARIRATWIHRPYLQSLLVSFLAAYGGGILSSLLLGEACSPLKMDALILAHIVAWYAYGYLPLVRVLVNLPVIRVMFGIYSNVLRAGLISMLVDEVNEKLGTSSNAMALIVATLGGSGGKFLLDAAHRLHFGQARTHGASGVPNVDDESAPAADEFAPELRCPSYSSRSALCCAVIQLTVVHRMNLLSPAAGAALNATLLVVNSLYVEMYGTEAYDVTGYLSGIFHALTGIPDPAPTGKSAIATQTDAPGVLQTTEVSLPALTATAHTSPMGSPPIDFYDPNAPLFLTTPVSAMPSANRDARDYGLGYRESATVASTLRSR